MVNWLSAMVVVQLSSPYVVLYASCLHVCFVVFICVLYFCNVLIKGYIFFSKKLHAKLLNSKTKKKKRKNSLTSRKRNKYQTNRNCHVARQPNTYWLLVRILMKQEEPVIWNIITAMVCPSWSGGSMMWRAWLWK